MWAIPSCFFLLIRTSGITYSLHAKSLPRNRVKVRHSIYLLLKLSKLIQPAEGSHTFVILRVSLRTSAATATARIQKSTELVTVGKLPMAIGIGISASGKWLIVAG